MSRFLEQQLKIETNEILDSAKSSERQNLLRKSRNERRTDTAIDIINRFWPLEENESVDVLTNGQSDVGGFFEAIIGKWEYCDQLNICTWMISRKNIDMLIHYLDKGLIKNLSFIISNRISQLDGRHKSNFNLMKFDLAKRNNVNFKITKTHAKIFSVKKDDNHIVISGSGNWSENPRYENYTILMSKTAFDFHEEWVNEIIRL